MYYYSATEFMIHNNLNSFELKEAPVSKFISQISLSIKKDKNALQCKQSKIVRNYP